MPVTYPDSLGVREKILQTVQSLRLYSDNLVKVLDDTADAPLYNGAAEANFRNRVKMIKRKLVLKYFAVDCEFYLNQSYGRWKDLRDLEFFDEKDGTINV